MISKVLLFLSKRDDVPNSKWTLQQHKSFCEEKNLVVIPEHGKRGNLVLDDYKKATKKYTDENGLKYTADTIMESYGFRCVRLPPYHPELNPIGNYY